LIETTIKSPDAQRAGGIDRNNGASAHGTADWRFDTFRTQQTGTGRFDMRFRMVAAQAVRFRMVAAQVV